MPLHSFLRSPAFFTGLGLTSSGAIGAGGWKIYDDTYPTVNRDLYNKGYSFNPIQAPDEAKPSNEKFTGSSWGCFQKLFPDVEVKHGKVEGTQAYSEDTTTELSPSNHLIACSIMELRPISASLEDSSKAYQNRVYFKSEVVIKGDDVGWVLGTGLSTAKASNSNGSYSNSLDFFYRLIFLRKESRSWKINSGYEGSNFMTADISGLSLFVKTSEESGLDGRKYTDATPFEARKGAGIGEIDNRSDKEVLQSMSVYIDKAEEAEIMGNDGKFNIPSSYASGPGYDETKVLYVKNEGGKDNAKSGGDKIGSTLIKWYEPFKGKKVKGTELRSRCSSWSRSRNLDDPLFGEFTSLCYTRASQ